MAITEHTRVCDGIGCGVPFEHAGEGLAVCPNCGQTLAPRQEAWPAHLKRWLLLEHARRSVAHVRANAQMAWEWFLCGRMRGEFDARGRTLTHVASAAECYPEAKRRADEWRDAGYPNLLNFDQPEQAPARKAS